MDKVKLEVNCPICGKHTASSRSLREILMTGGNLCEALAIARLVGVTMADSEDPMTYYKRANAHNVVKTRSLVTTR